VEFNGPLKKKGGKTNYEQLRTNNGCLYSPNIFCKLFQR